MESFWFGNWRSIPKVEPGTCRPCRWDLVSSSYFTFVTLTTIGFGDYTPVKSFNGFEHDPVAAMKMVFTVSYCIFGMTLLSMCMNLMQEQIVEKVMILDPGYCL